MTDILTTGGYIPPRIETLREQVIDRMTAVEMHTWRRAVARAEATNSPTVNDRNALTAWYKFFLPQTTAQLSDDDVAKLKAVWIAHGMSDTRADALLAPVAE